jgi:Fe2+ or Zn2+ uptake regulation protein
MRSSIYKDKVRSVLQGEHLLSLAHIQEKLGGVDFSTVFRNVEQLVAEGLVKKIVISKDTVLYEMVNQKHNHDHFVCNDCGVVESVRAPKFELKGKAIVTDVLVRGTCGDCIT